MRSYQVALNGEDDELASRAHVASGNTEGLGVHGHLKSVAGGGAEGEQLADGL